MKNHRMMEESIWKHDRSKRCTYRLVWQGRLLGINQRDIGRENRSDRQLIIDDIFTIMGVGTVATGNILIGMCREGENACIYKANGDILETRITTVDVHTKERKANGCGYKTEHVGLGLRGISKEQLEKGDKVIVKNANMYGM